jgi:hypothetical protein
MYWCCTKYLVRRYVSYNENAFPILSTGSAFFFLLVVQRLTIRYGSYKYVHTREVDRQSVDLAQTV